MIEKLLKRTLNPNKQQKQQNYDFDDKVGSIKDELLLFWILSMCKLRQITHKLKPFGLYSVCEWLDFIDV